METIVYSCETEDIEKAAEVLKSGGLIAFPTETVYGLGADAFNERAVRAIYEAKGRPSDNPTICHIADERDVTKLTDEVTGDMRLLAEKFWPGPLTMVVRKKPEVPYVTTGGLDTVGVRMPETNEARALIRQAGTPIAAPSANLSGKPSPTRARDVLEDLGGMIDGIIASGEACRVGIESTVLDMTGESPMILRPGEITKEMLEEALGKEVLLDPSLNKAPSGTEERPKAPGMKYRHYAPKGTLIVFRGKDAEKVTGAIESKRMELEASGERVKVLDFRAGGEEEAARILFGELRQADREGATYILAPALEERGFGFSVMNRLLKSSGYNIIDVD